MQEIETVKLALILAALFIATELQAQQLVFQFNNPSFGGNPYTGQWLLSEAQAQNTLEDDKKSSGALDKDPLQDFKDGLNRNILSQLSRKIMNSMFGEEELTQGHYEIGDYLIDITPGSDGINIQINDQTNGNATTVIVPYY